MRAYYFLFLFCCSLFLTSQLAAQDHYGGNFRSTMSELKSALNENISNEERAEKIVSTGRAFAREKRYKAADSIYALSKRYEIEDGLNINYYRGKANASFYFEEKKKNKKLYTSPERLYALRFFEAALETSSEANSKDAREQLRTLEKDIDEDVRSLVHRNNYRGQTEENLELAGDLTELYLKYYPRAYPYEWRNRKEELHDQLRFTYKNISRGFSMLMEANLDKTYTITYNGKQYQRSKADYYYQLATKYADKAHSLDIYNKDINSFISSMRLRYSEIESKKKDKRLIQQEKRYDSSTAELSSLKGEMLRERIELDSLKANKEKLMKEVEEEHAKLEESSLRMEEVKKTLGQTAILLENQKLISAIFSMVSILILVLLIVSIRNYRKQKAQRVIIEKNRNEIQQQHMEITDSIVYAKRIQSAIMPPLKLIKEYLNDSFIFYVPKDVVAGDFYWMLPLDKDGKTIFAAADCTGHGVPGAMVSVVCNSALNRSVKEFGLQKPGDILTKTRDLVMQEFEKADEQVRDGMDIALCSLKGNKLEYAGANNPLWIIRKGSKEVEVINAHKQAIGLTHKPSPFPTHEIELNKGDSFYIFSDGYADQFGGENGKKFKAPNFRDYLLSIQDLNMDEQLISISKKFHSWKGELEQLDDVCVIGVRV